MHPSPATMVAVSRLLSETLATAARDLPCFEAGDRVWIKVKACERLIRRGLGPTVWREGVVVQCMDSGRLHEVTDLHEPSLTVQVEPSEIRFHPPWKPNRHQRNSGTNP